MSSSTLKRINVGIFWIYDGIIVMGGTSWTKMAPFFFYLIVCDSQKVYHEETISLIFWTWHLRISMIVTYSMICHPSISQTNTFFLMLSIYNFCYSIQFLLMLSFELFVSMDRFKEIHFNECVCVIDLMFKHLNMWPGLSLTTGNPLNHRLKCTITNYIHAHAFIIFYKTNLN